MAINRTNPAGTYTTSYTSFIFSQVENFKNYPNTLAFHSANEVINDNTSSTIDPPYLRVRPRLVFTATTLTSPGRHARSEAVHRQAFQPPHPGRLLGRRLPRRAGRHVELPAVHDRRRDRADSRSEFFGLNSYSWCGASATYTSAGYDTLVSMFAGTSIPVFFSEYGCNEPKGVPRVFNEVGALYGPDMTGLNGGLVYEYSEEPDVYGLVNISAADGSVTLRQDYVNLLGQFNKLDTKPPDASARRRRTHAGVLQRRSSRGASGLSNNFTIPAAAARHGRRHRQRRHGRHQRQDRARDEVRRDAEDLRRRREPHHGAVAEPDLGVERAQREEHHERQRWGLWRVERWVGEEERGRCAAGAGDGVGWPGCGNGSVHVKRLGGLQQVGRMLLPGNS